jgi:hypothetical protein
MTVARRRQLDRLEKLAAPRMEQIRVAREQRELEILRQIYRDADIHAANLSLIILLGDPGIEEPLYQAHGKDVVRPPLLNSAMMFRKGIC